MAKVVLTVIPKPEPQTRIVLVLSEGGLKGDGPIDLACGDCDTVLAQGVPDERLHKLRAAVIERFLSDGGVGVSGGEEALVLKCCRCRAYNEVPPK